jgi:beta-glucanase (GH16 family)
MTTEATGVNLADCRVDTPQTIKVSDGTLKLTVLDTGAPFVCTSSNGDYTTQYAAGAVSTGRKFSQAFGRFEIRAAMPDVTVAGLHSAIWMWPQDQRYGTLSGEIDINERRTQMADRAVPTVHYSDNGTAGPKTAWDCVIDSPQNFHTYALEWTQTTLTFIYDGKVCLSHEWQPAGLTKPKPFDEPYFLILNQDLGVLANAYDPAATPLPATMTVDYVRVWS